MWVEFVIIDKTSELSKSHRNTIHINVLAESDYTFCFCWNSEKTNISPWINSSFTTQTMTTNALHSTTDSICIFFSLLEYFFNLDSTELWADIHQLWVHLWRAWVQWNQGWLIHSFLYSYYWYYIKRLIWCNKYWWQSPMVLLFLFFSLWSTLFLKRNLKQVCVLSGLTSSSGPYHTYQTCSRHRHTVHETWHRPWIQKVCLWPVECKGQISSVYSTAAVSMLGGLQPWLF